MALPKVKYGDVFEIKTYKGFGYFQCVKEAPATDVEVIRVFNNIFSSVEDVNFDYLVNDGQLYFLHFPLKYAVKKKCVRYIGNYSVSPHVTVPRYYRSMHKIGTKLICWHIVDSETLERRSTLDLSDEERSLSPWGSWNDTLLAERMASGWTLEKWI
ncbi:MAG: hypothetical protein PHN21_06735 [Erysipelotrichaceae bacterium]|nr:hypothetical protein [Erysipelotrichaceae bacterium]